MTSFLLIPGAPLRDHDGLPIREKNSAICKEIQLHC